MSLPSQVFDAEEIESNLTRQILKLGDNEAVTHKQPALSNEEQKKPCEVIDSKSKTKGSVTLEPSYTIQSSEQADVQNLEKSGMEYKYAKTVDLNALDRTNLKQISINQEGQLNLKNLNNHAANNSRFEMEKSKPTSLMSIPEDEGFAKNSKQQYPSLNSLFASKADIGSITDTRITLDKPIDNISSITELKKSKELGASSIQELPDLENQSPANQEAPSCKICLDSQQNEESGFFVKPCRCTGSMQWIHDKCLKTWILSKGKRICDSSCELCGTLFNMSYKYKTKLNLRRAFSEKISKLITCCCMSLVLLGVLTIIVTVSLFWYSSNQNGGGDNSYYRVSILVGCGILSAILLMFILFALKDICFKVEIQQWDILSPDLNIAPIRNRVENQFSYNDDSSRSSSIHGSSIVNNRSRVQPQRDAEQASSYYDDESQHQSVHLAPDRSNTSLDISVNKDLNTSGASEGVPLKFVSRLRNREGLGAANQSLVNIDEALPNNNRIIDIRTLNKCYSASGLPDNGQNQAGHILNSRYQEKHDSNELVKRSIELASANQFDNTRYERAGDLSRSAPYDNFSRSDLTKEVNDPVVQRKKFAPILPFKGVTKEITKAEN